jgi:hypothetical protein
LVVTGAFFVLLAVGIWMWGSFHAQTVHTTMYANTTTSTASTTTTTPTKTAAAVTAISLSPTPPTTSSPTTTTQTIARTTPQTIVNSSDTIVLGVTSLGITLFLAGAFFTRITSITLPGGGVISLTTPGQQAAVASISKHTSKDEAGGRVGKDAYVEFMRRLQEEEDVSTITADKIDALVVESVRAVGGTP